MSDIVECFLEMNRYNDPSFRYWIKELKKVSIRAFGIPNALEYICDERFHELKKLGML